MTDCPCYRDDEVALRYVTSDLAESERTAFEDHLFACDACLTRVERYQAAQQDLSRRQLPSPPTVVLGPDPHPAKPRPLFRWVTLGAVAASLLVVLGGWSLWTPESESAPRPPAVARDVKPLPPAAPAVGSSPSALGIAVLAMVTPPAYVTITTRGTADSAFADAMQSYTQSDWPAASRALAPLASPDARFYKGIADLMLGDPAGAVASFESVRSSGRQPYARESLFYLGKAALQRGDVPAATSLLTEARQAGAGPDGEAEDLLTALAELER